MVSNELYHTHDVRFFFAVVRNPRYFTVFHFRKLYRVKGRDVEVFLGTNFSAN